MSKIVFWNWVFDHVFVQNLKNKGFENGHYKKNLQFKLKQDENLFICLLCVINIFFLKLNKFERCNTLLK